MSLALHELLAKFGPMGLAYNFASMLASITAINAPTSFSPLKMTPKHSINCLHLPPSFLLPRLSPTFVAKRGIKSILKQKETRFRHGPGLPILEASTQAALKRKAYTTPLRTGALGLKKGMSAMYDTETGRRQACTIVQMDRVQVVAHKTQKKNGYYAVQVGSGWKHPSNVTRPLLGHFAENGISPKRHLVEFKVRDKNGLLDVGTMIGAGWFQEGQYVDARANCRGMGFAGGMKRHGWSGQGASHGISKTHRTMGSAGGSQGSGSRVIPGKKMPGRMGGQQVTTQNVKVLKVDNEKGIVVLNGKWLSSHSKQTNTESIYRMHSWPKRLSGQALGCH